MANSPDRILGQLAGTASALLTVPAGQKYILNGGTVTNANGADVSDIEFYIYPNGGSASNATARIPEFSLVDGQFKYLNLRDHLNAGDVLAAKAGTASAVNYHIPFTVISG